ncbi:MAG: MFS transporter [Planctomycetes bacterium]|nr:MFS transporter [Planctomycetota bacterium]
MRRSSLLVVFLTVFVDLLGFGIVIPLLPLYTKDYGGSELTGGLVVGAFSAMQFLFAPFWGRLSDRLGRRPVLATTLLGTALSYLLFAFARDLTVLFAARTLAGFFGANIPVAQAYVADVTTPETRARGMGMIGMAFGLGFVLGPAFGALLSEHVGRAAPGLAAAALSGTAFVIAWARLPESLSPELRSKASARRAHPILFLSQALRRPELGGVLVLFFFLVAGFANLESMLSYFVEDRYGWGKLEVGRLFAFIGLCIAFAQGFLFRRAAARFGEVRLLRTGPLFVAAGMQVFWLVPVWPLLLPAVAIVALGMGMSNPSVPSLISKRSPPHMQGQTLGLSQSLGALARAVAPPVAGLLYDRVRVPSEGGCVTPFLWGGVLLVVGLALGRRGLVATAADAAPPAAAPSVE